MQYRKTIAKSATLSGIGVHSGNSSTVTFYPAKYGDNITFLCPGSVSAHWGSITSTHLSTTISNASGHSVTMVEHLLSACYGLGITDLTIDLLGSEAPILDGSAKIYLDALLAAGCVSSAKDETLWMVVQRPIRITEKDRWVEWRPGSPLFSVKVAPDEGVLHEYSFDPIRDSFEKDIAPARTFMRLADVEKMKALGYIRGGSLDVSLVWDGGNPINPGGMLLDNETARHKILDMMGDFALLGAFIYGQTHALNPGHHLNYRLMSALKEDPSAVTWCHWSQIGHHSRPTPVLAPTKVISA
jgi:UDP-3-O-[3-hydroxymyristoyl] N-acetylglucosamine deacetylase